MGESASTDTTEDDQPKPAFDSPLAVLAVVALPPALGGAGVLVLRGRRGIEADATGVRQLGRVPAAQPWPGVSDEIRAGRMARRRPPGGGERA